MGHRRHDPSIVLAEGETTATAHPRPPQGLLAATRKAWHTYWDDEISAITRGVDHQVINRLFGLYDEHARARVVVKQALMVKGSTGQIRTNPLADHILKLETAILRLENELGLTPSARMRLGIRFVERPKPVHPEGWVPSKRADPRLLDRGDG